MIGQLVKCVPSTGESMTETRLKWAPRGDLGYPTHTQTISCDAWFLRCWVLQRSTSSSSRL